MENSSIEKRECKSMPVVEAGYNGLSKLTQKAYDQDFRLFNHIINKDITDIKSNDILIYKKVLEERGYKNNTINRKIYSLSKIMNLYKLQGVIKSNPISDLNQIKRITKPVNNQVNLGIDPYDLKIVCRRQNRTTMIIKTLASTGMRISEMLNITTKDITPYNINGRQFKKIQITGKGNKERTVFITVDLYNEIKEVFKQSKKGYLFQSRTGNRIHPANAYKMVRKMFFRITGKHVYPHLLRHYYASHKIATEKKDIRSVSKYLGHSSVSITLNYYVHTALDPEDAILDMIA
jgi:integrase/recombinase XerD